jgi:hypothetical protein
LQATGRGGDALPVSAAVIGTFWVVKLMKQSVDASVEKVSKIAAEKAAKMAAKGGNVQASSKQKARQIARAAATDPKAVRRDPGHPLKDPAGNPTGQIGRPHYHTGNSNGGHIFWSSVAAIGTGLSTALDVVDQLTNPFYVTEVR